MSSEQDLSSLTVVQLKKELSKYGLHVSGRKAELVERLSTHLKKQAPSAGQAEESSMQVDEPDASSAAPQTSSSSPSSSSSSSPSSSSSAASAAEATSSVTKSTPPAALVQSSASQMDESTDLPTPVRAVSSSSSSSSSATSGKSIRAAEKRKHDAAAPASPAEETPTTAESSAKKLKFAESASRPEPAVSTDSLNSMIQEEIGSKATTSARTADDDERVDYEDEHDRPQVKVLEDEGDVETKEEPLEKESEMLSLHIEGFVRPFRVENAQEMLGQYGKLDFFWMNTIRSQAVVTYADKETAHNAATALNELVWPPTNNHKLKARKITSAEVKQLTESATPAPAVPTTPTTPTTPSKRPPIGALMAAEREKARAERAARLAALKEESERARAKQEAEKLATQHAQQSQPPAESTPTGSLDRIFKKTLFPPPLYFMPLSEQEANDREAARKAGTLEAFDKARLASMMTLTERERAADTPRSRDSHPANDPSRDRVRDEERDRDRGRDRERLRGSDRFERPQASRRSFLDRDASPPPRFGARRDRADRAIDRDWNLARKETLQRESHASTSESAGGPERERRRD